MFTDPATIKQHLIDPEICIRCNTCETTCPVDAITHEDNYVVDASKCNLCMDCISPCPTGSIDNWRIVASNKVYSVDEQLAWDELPDELTSEELAEAIGKQVSSKEPVRQTIPSTLSSSGTENKVNHTQYGSHLPPWSAAHAYTNLYSAKSQKPSVKATVAGNVRVTEVGKEYDTHHIVLDFASNPFPVLEGQSIGILPPGTDSKGNPHHARQYSIASPRNGERAGYNNISLTIKRVLEDHQGNPVRGVCSNYMCDLKAGDEVNVIGPFGSSFLMPNHPRSNIVMICTGTGSAPMRAMTEWRRRLRASGKFEGGKLMLFFGARSRTELPYFGPLQKLPNDFIDIEFAFSREKNKTKEYVQDRMRKRAPDLGKLLENPDTYFYVCGLRSMEEGVLLALSDIAKQAGLNWEEIVLNMRQKGRLHLETY